MKKSDDDFARKKIWNEPYQELFKQKDFRAVICPSLNDILLLNPRNLKQAYKDLETWALPIHPLTLDQ